MGSIGGDIDYIVTDAVASPLEYEEFYSEKFLHMPHSFIVNSFSYLEPEIMPPLLSAPTSPQQTGCGGPPASFVFCNFNKQLKFDPIVFRLWMETIQEVKGSVLCLQENPKDSIRYLNYFIKNFNSSLQSRVRYIPFDHNIGPFETKKRVENTCNVVLDNFAYGAHTTAVEALWAGYLTLPPSVTSCTLIDLTYLAVLQGSCVDLRYGERHERQSGQQHYENARSARNDRPRRRGLPRHGHRAREQ